MCAPPGKSSDGGRDDFCPIQRVRLHFSVSHRPTKKTNQQRPSPMMERSYISISHKSTQLHLTATISADFTRTAKRQWNTIQIVLQQLDTHHTAEYVIASLLRKQQLHIIKHQSITNKCVKTGDGLSSRKQLSPQYLHHNNCFNSCHATASAELLTVCCLLHAKDSGGVNQIRKCLKLPTIQLIQNECRRTDKVQQHVFEPNLMLRRHSAHFSEFGDYLDATVRKHLITIRHGTN